MKMLISVTISTARQAVQLQWRVQVRLGRGSVSTMEILGGLKEGDVVLLNDMSNYDNVDRIQFSPKVVQVK